MTHLARFAIALLLAIPALLSAQTQTTLTGNLSSIGAPGSDTLQVRITLVNCGAANPVVPGVTNTVTNQITLTANSSGAVSTPIWGNDVIQCSSVASTAYQAQYLRNGVPTGVPAYYRIAGSTPFNLTSATPITTLPPTGNLLSGYVCAQGFVMQGFSAGFAAVCEVAPTGPQGEQGPQGLPGNISAPGPVGSVLASGYAGSQAAATPSQVVIGLGYSSGSVFVGDSTACATGTTSSTVGGVYTSALQNGYAWLMTSIVGGDHWNDCYPGVTETDINNITFFHADNEGVGSPTFFGEGFINDSTNANATNSNYQASQKYGLQAQVLFRAIPRINKVFAQDPAITQTGFTGDTAYQYGWGASSTTTGSTWSCPVTIGADGHGVVWALVKDGNGGTWTGSWSGTGGGALVDPVTSSTTFTATGYGGLAIAGLTFNSEYVAYVVSGLSPGTHTFTGTVSSATGAGNVVDFGGCAGLPAANVNLPWDFEAGVPYQNSGGAADATTAAYDAIVTSVAATAAALPLNVAKVDVRSSLLNSPNCGNGSESAMFLNCYADFKHLTNTGYAAEVNTPTTGYAAVVAAANPALTLGGLKNPRLGPMNLYPNMPPVDTSRWFSVNGNLNAHGYGITFNCANGSQNCSGIGDFTNYGTALNTAGGPGGIINCPGETVNPRAVSNCTQFITTNPNGSMGFFTTGGSVSNGIAYFSSGSVYLGGLPGYQQSGVFITAPQSGVATQIAATSGANQNSYPWLHRGTCWTGTQNFPADAGFQNFIGGGSSASETLALIYQYGCGGAKYLDLTAATGGVKLPSVVTIGGANIGAAVTHGASTTVNGQACVLDGSCTVTLLGAPTFGTPSSSSAACTVPQVEYDAAYIYTCVATNVWRRAATSTF